MCYGKTPDKIADISDIITAIPDHFPEKCGSIPKLSGLLRPVSSFSPQGSDRSAATSDSYTVKADILAG
jgi:hypothetical protein